MFSLRFAGGFLAQMWNTPANMQKYPQDAIMYPSNFDRPYLLLRNQAL